VALTPVRAFTLGRKGSTALRFRASPAGLAHQAATGRHFGELALVGETGTRNSTAVAIDATETLGLHRDQFDELRQKYRSFDDVLVVALANEVRRLSARLAEALYVPVETRVVGLWDIAKRTRTTTVVSEGNPVNYVAFFPRRPDARHRGQQQRPGAFGAELLELVISILEARPLWGAADEYDAIAVVRPRARPALQQDLSLTLRAAWCRPAARARRVTERAPPHR